MRYASVKLALLILLFAGQITYGAEYRSVGRSGYDVPKAATPPAPEKRQPKPVPQVKREAKKPETAPKPAAEPAPAPEPAPKQTAPGKPAKIRLFDTVEIRKPLQAIPGWLDVMERNRREPIFEMPEPVFDRPKPYNNSTKWAALQKRAQGLSKLEQLRLVNSFWNKWKYIEDPKNYGVSDYWAIPAQFIQRSGDCEDYAIAKYFTLRELGFDPSQMRIIVVQDAVRRLAHAVLSVNIDGEAYILDNLSNIVLPHKRLRNYQPQYSVNESGLWGHMKTKGQKRSEK